MIRHASFVVIAVFALGLAACGSSGNSLGGSGSCTIASSNACVEWSSTFDSAAQSACTTESGTYASAACTSTGRVGRCLVVFAATASVAQYSAQTSFYAGTAATLQAACQQQTTTGITATWTNG
jgi:hypothetical protein